MMFLLSLVFWLAVVAGVLALAVHLNARFFRVETEPDAVHFAVTEDGWRLALTRYHPSTPLDGAPPVLLCPGAGMSSALFDVTAETSLARYLSSHGHDLWLLDPRGRGLSRPRRRANWSFDDYVEFDLPAALRLICEQTGARQVQCIGFGVGALTVLAALADGGDAGRRVGSLAALAAPVLFRRQQGSFGPRLLRTLRRVRVDLLARLLAPLLGRLFPGALAQLQNRDNVDGAVYRRALVNGLSRLSKNELLQYAEWLEQDVFTATVQRRDYRSAMANISTPTLFIAGPRDALAPVDMVEGSANLLDGVEDRVLVVASRMHGMSTNYGHLDLLLGRGVQRDIYSHLLKWLDLHAGVELPAGRPEPPEPREGWSGEEPRRKQREDDTPRAIPPPAEQSSGPAAPAADGEDEPRGGTEEPDAPEQEPGAAEQPDDDLDLGDEEESEEDLVQGDVPRLPS